MIEDDYDSEFRFTERPLETLHSMDDAGRVLYLGTFSKSLVPGLRVGYLVAPEPLQDALRAALQLSVGYVDGARAGGAGPVPRGRAVRAAPAQGAGGVRRAARPWCSRPSTAR